jgi:hypothetical protein
MKQMKIEVNLGEYEENAGNSPYLRGKIDDFCETGLLLYYYRNTDAVT